MKFISALFHPLLMGSYMSVLLAIYFPDAFGPYTQEMVWRLVIAFTLLTALFPALAVLGLWAFTPWVSDLELIDKKERSVPFFVLIFFYGVAAKFLVFDLSLGPIVRVLLIGAILMIALMVLINTRFKISIHCAAIWSLAGSAVGLAWKFPETQLMSAAIVSIICGGLIGTSRLYLGYHRPVEVWVGSLFGFYYSLGLVMLLL